MIEALIDLDALRHNARLARRLAPASRQMAVIKADAYGHGMVAVARALGGIADGLAVARLEEAQTLRQAGLRGRLLVMSSRPSLEQLHYCAREHLDLVIHEADTLGLLRDHRLTPAINAWLKVDTGMHRLGVAPEAVAAAYQSLRESPSVGEVVLMSHFASADTPGDDVTARQIACFERATRGLDAPVSLANSAGLIAHPQSHRDWVRPGLMLYGASPVSPDPGLRPVMTLRSALLAVRRIPPGDAVGYNATWVSPRGATIGTVMGGYGDGYPRHAPSGTPVLVNGRTAPLVGRVSMDMITVDLSEQPEARAGDEVVLWGRGLPVAEIAARAGTISYELLTRVSPRPPRRYY